ncbi:hypothetical protein CLOP_g8744 [Closterium sp. NIES-67]|nr:hypothetical protein CLOP_g8744 [Closterium sp. NIES-67]
MQSSGSAASLALAVTTAGAAAAAVVACRLLFSPAPAAAAEAASEPSPAEAAADSHTESGTATAPSRIPNSSDTSLSSALEWLASAASGIKDHAERLVGRGKAGADAPDSGSLDAILSCLPEGYSLAGKAATAAAIAAAAVVAVGGTALAIRAAVGASRRKRRQRVIGIIPARFASSRFVGKPLALIAGQPMIQHTWERAKLAQTLDRVVVATDDERIARCCEGFGAEVIMTSAACSNGSERCAEAVEKLKGKWDVVVNIQGDEPLIDPATIDAVVIALREAPEAVAATAVADLKAASAPDPNRVKCVVDNRGFALYFSRALIPHNRDGVPHPGFPYMLHLGLQAYDAAFLAHYRASEAGRLEEEEQLEQLRMLEQGHRVKVVKVAHAAHGVDVPGDVKRIEELLLRGGR